MYGRAIVIACVTAFAVASATAFAGAGARADGVIVGCQKPGKGFLRVVRDASDCRRNERVSRGTNVARQARKAQPDPLALRAGGSPGAEG